MTPRPTDDCTPPRRARRTLGMYRAVVRAVAIPTMAAAAVLALGVPASAAPAAVVEAAPAGANDFSCVPSPEHPRPVILVHGTGSNMALTWKALSPALKAQGYCVFALNYGSHAPGSDHNLLNMVGGGSIPTSATALAAFTARVRQATHASQVDMVGHSQGALVIRQYLKDGGGTDARNPSRNIVSTMVSLAGTNHGSTFNLNETLAAIADSLGVPVVTLAATTIGPSYIEQMVGSPFLTRLNAGGDTRPGVTYVAIGTKDDGVVTPADRTFLRGGPGASVRNVWMQDGCPDLAVDHIGVTTDARSLGLVLGALDRNYQRTHPLPCR